MLHIHEPYRHAHFLNVQQCMNKPKYMRQESVVLSCFLFFFFFLLMHEVAHGHVRLRKNNTNNLTGKRVKSSSLFCVVMVFHLVSCECDAHGRIYSTRHWVCFSLTGPLCIFLSVWTQVSPSVYFQVRPAFCVWRPQSCFGVWVVDDFGLWSPVYSGAKLPWSVWTNCLPPPLLNFVRSGGTRDLWSGKLMQISTMWLVHKTHTHLVCDVFYTFQTFQTMFCSPSFITMSFPPSGLWWPP